LRVVSGTLLQQLVGKVGAALGQQHRVEGRKLLAASRPQSAAPRMSSLRSPTISTRLPCSMGWLST